MLFWHLKSTLRFSPAISNHKLFHNKLSPKARKVYLDVAVLTQELRDRNKSLELESVMQCERFIWLQGCCYCGLRCRSWWHLAAVAWFISACLERYPICTAHAPWCWFILFICLQTPFKISLLIIFRILLCNQKSVCRFVSRAKKGWSYLHWWSQFLLLTICCLQYLPAGYLSWKCLILIWRLHYLALLSLHKLSCLGLPDIKGLNLPSRAFLLNGYIFCPCFTSIHMLSILFAIVVAENMHATSVT